MEIRLETNQRYGRGFQLRLLHGPMNKVYDKEPWTLYEAGAATQMLLEEANKTLGTDYKLTQVCHIPEDALTDNAGTDFAAARMLQDIRSKSFNLSIPATADYKTAEIDGEEEVVLSARGVVLFAYLAWMDEKNPKSHDILRRFCEYIATHGFKGGASAALAELDAFASKEEGLDWIRCNYARFVLDNGNGLMDYILGALA